VTRAWLLRAYVVVKTCPLIPSVSVFVPTCALSRDIVVVRGMGALQLSGRREQRAR
jgi:hypothetical protein